MITIDNLAFRYGLLPSEVLARATTFDLTVLDVSARWERYQFEKQNGKLKTEVPDLSEQEMLDMIRKVKEDVNKSQHK